MQSQSLAFTIPTFTVPEEKGRKYVVRNASVTVGVQCAGEHADCAVESGAPLHAVLELQERGKAVQTCR